MWRRLPIIIICLCSILALNAQEPPASAPASAPSALAVHDGDLILFLGDELIDAPEPRASTNFPFLVETFLAARYPLLKARFVYAGWSGDTVGRALLRLDRDALSRKPTLVVVCLGLNDPDYAPFSEERLTQFKSDLDALIERIRASGARVWLISPPSVREDLSTNARIVRDGQSALVNLQIIEYNQTLATYTAAIREAAAASGSGFVNWHEASSNNSAAAVNAAGWRDGRLPSPQSHALIAAELLRAWRAEPIDVSIEMGWNAANATLNIDGLEAATAAVETTEDGRRSFSFDGLPFPWPVPGARNGIRPEWEAADMSRFVLRVPDPPARNVILRVEAGNGSPANALPMTAAQLQSGFNLATADTLRGIRPVQDLMQAIGAKNFYQYSTWRRQEFNPPKEPELAGAHRQLVSAMYAYAAGYEQVIQRLPKSFSARFVLSEAVPPERLPTAWPIGARPSASRPASRPATRPRPSPTTMPTTATTSMTVASNTENR